MMTAADFRICTDPLIEQAIEDNAFFWFSLSGGKDCGAVSAATMAYLDSRGHPRERRGAMHADLGRAEWLFNEMQVRAQAAALGLPLTIERNTSGDLFRRFNRRWELALQAYVAMECYNLRSPWSTPSNKFCQSEQKISVMGPAAYRDHIGETVVQVTGLRREESRARAATPVAKDDKRFLKPTSRAAKAGTLMRVWNPGVLLTTQDVFEMNASYGIPLSPVYGMGGSRHSCRWCIMANQNDLEVACRHPENLEMLLQYVGLEIDSTFSFQAARWLGEIAPDVLPPLTRAAVANAKMLGAQRRAAELSMPAHHRYVDGWPLHIPTPDEAVQILAARNIILDHHYLTSPYDTPQKIIDRFAELKAIGDAKRLAKGE